MNAPATISAPITISAQALRANAGLIRYLAAHAGEHDTAQALADATGRHRENVRKTLKTLRDAGVIARESPIALTDAGAALLDQLPPATPEPEANPVRAEAMPEGFALVDYLLIVPDLLNPRKDFDEDGIVELAASIQAHGLLQNLVVRRAEPMEGYGQPMHRLVAGERRWRAIRKLIAQGDWPVERGVPVRIQTLDDDMHAVVALLENLQRQDLKPLEEARAFKRLIDHHGFKTADIAARINATQRVVQQRLQLLELPPIQAGLVDKGHMTIREAREFLAKRPKSVDVTPAQLLMLAEVAHRIVAKVPIRANVQAQVDWTVKTDAAFDELVSLKLAFRRPVYDGRFEVGLTELGVRTLHDKAPGFEDGRGAALKLIREGGMTERALARLDKDRFATPWLNRPYGRDPEVLRRDQQHERERKAADAERAAREREFAEEKQRDVEEGARLLRDIRALERDAPGLDHEAFTARFVALLATYRANGPWRIKASGTPPEANIFDALGRPNVGYGPMLEGRRRLIVLAVNYAAGFAAFTGEPFRDVGVAPDEDADEDDDDDEAGE